MTQLYASEPQPDIGIARKPHNTNRGLMVLRYCFTFEVSASASAWAALMSRPRSSRVRPRCGGGGSFGAGG